MKKIMHKVTPGGSPFGIHSYMAYLGCARQAALWEKVREGGTVDPLGRTKALRIGTLFHLFRDAYEQQGADNRFDAGAVEFSQTTGESLVIDEAERQEAQRLFVAWQAEYWDTPLGETLASELAIDDSEGFGLLAGIRPITARLDRVFKVSAKAAPKIARAYGITLKPGIYVQDYKTAARRDDKETLAREMDWQFPLYQLAAQLKYGLEETPSLVVSTIYKTSTVGFEHRVIKPPVAEKIQGLRDMLRLAKERRTAAKPEYNPTACTSFFDGACYFYTTGECRRTAAR
jgi:hypothetical protein